MILVCVYVIHILQYIIAMFDSTVIQRPADLSEVCRLCLKFHNQLSPIFDNQDQVSCLPVEISLPSKIMACVSVKVSPTDPGPSKICPKCVNNINSWYQFNEECKTVDAYLQKYLNEVVEQNVPSSKVDDITSSACENSLFGEISLSSFDSVLEKNVNLKSNLSSILDVYFNNEMPQLDYESDKIADANTIITTSETPVTDKNSEALTSKPADGDPPEVNLGKEKPSKKHRKGYNCELCDDTFARFANLLNHDDTVHQDVFRKFSCPTCGRLFISENRLKLHQLSHREKLHKCTTCDKLFSSAKSLQVHSRLHSGKYKCTTCGYVSTSKRYLEEHLLKHVGNETVYMCRLCSMSFTSRSSLLRHENIHLKHGGKIYKCSICSLVTRRRCELQEHVAAHSSENTTIEYKCHLCSKSYRSKKTLRVHVLRHNEGQFVCKTCHKKLFSKYELREHEETHSHVKQFNCFHCDKKFSFRSSLNTHLKSNIPRVRSDIATE